MTSPVTVNPDPDLQKVSQYIRSVAGPSVQEFFAALVRQAIDEVLDGPRTGRYLVSSLTKTEKTYVGTKIEIILKNALDLPSGSQLDLVVSGVEFDIKWSQDSSWMIPGEYVNGTKYARPPLCLFLGTDRAGGQVLNVALGRPIKVLPGVNRDGKRTLTFANLSAQSPDAPDVLVRRGHLPRTFLSKLPAAALSNIMAEKKGHPRVQQLLKETIGQIIPREAVEAMAQQKDAMRRIREDNSRPSTGVKVLVGDWRIDRDIALNLFGKRIKKGQLLPVNVTSLCVLSPDKLQSLLDKKS